MSVYRDTDQSPVSFRHPIGTALTATVTNSAGTVLDTVSGIAPTAGVYQYLVPWTLTQYDAKYNLVWTDGLGFSRKQTFEVVTPIVDIPNLRTVWPTDQNPTDAEVAEVEGVVRAVIQAYTGQPFGYSVGSKQYIGNGYGKIILNERCDSLLGILGGWSFLPSDFVQYDYTTNPATVVSTNTNGELNISRAGLTEDGWTLLIEWPEFLTVKESPPMELIDSAPSQDGTIRIPRRFYEQRDKGVQYTLYGEWGYVEVPDEVQEAAVLLANDYLTGDSGYRDRYLEILKIQQDSFTYHPGAFRGTGNARADLLLGSYRRMTRMIIL